MSRPVINNNAANGMGGTEFMGTTVFAQGRKRQSRNRLFGKRVFQVDGHPGKGFHSRQAPDM